MKKIYYNSADTTGQSILAAAVASLKHPDATIIDTAGKDNTDMAALVTDLTDDTHDAIIICEALVASHAAGKFTMAQAQSFIAKLKTANQGSTVTGTAQANSTKTNIKLAAADTGEDDEYNNLLIVTAGDVAVTRLITDYNGTSKVATVADTGTAVDGSETYTIYTGASLYIWGEASATRAAAANTWSKAFTNQKQMPKLFDLLEGDGFVKWDKTATAVAAGTISDTSEFTAGEYDDQDYFVAIMDGTLGIGQVRKITENTVTVLTLEKDWDVTPTGTIKYQIMKGEKYCLYDKYLLYAILTYLNDLTNGNVLSEVKKLIDRYDDMYGGKKYSYQDLALMDEYAEKGKHICEALWEGVVS